MAKVRLAGDIAGFVELSAPDTAGNNTLVLPDSNGSANQILSTNGSGILNWSSQVIAIDGGNFDNGSSTVTTTTVFDGGDFNA
jgi:hypothetical protein